MSRPEFVTEEDIERWSKAIDLTLPSALSKNLFFREVCYAGQWLGENLELLGCLPDFSFRIVYTAGQLSHGKDPWEIVQTILKAYQANELLDEEPESEGDYTIN